MTNQLTRYCCLLLAIAITAANTAFSQQATDNPQSWAGTLDVGAAKLRLRFDIQTDDDGKLKCTMTSIDQGKAKITMDSCTVEANEFVIKSDKLKLVYEGTYKNNNIRIQASFEGMVLPSSADDRSRD
jgi:hypothetical protein